MALSKPLPASTSTKVLLPKVRLPVLSSIRLKMAGGLSTGASFTALTLWLITTVPLLKALVPPRLLASISVAVVTVALLSISTTSRVGAAPLKSWAGTKRIQSVLLRLKAAAAEETAAMVLQLPPALEEYSQRPLALAAL